MLVIGKKTGEKKRFEVMNSQGGKNRGDISVFSKDAYRFIILLGVVSLLADLTYEGARSITGPFLGSLGANATIVGIVAGVGELFGYGLRLLSGYISDKTGKYWLIVIFGYAFNLLSVPALALAGKWELAAFLIILERVGKAIRTPARDVMLSHATSVTGRGWGFGLHEAMDQVGAILGPLAVAFVLFQNGTYRKAFAFLLIPAVMALGTLLFARKQYLHPRRFEKESMPLRNLKESHVFWIYTVGISFIAMGYADFPLIAYHFQNHSIITRGMIPIFYAVAMGVDAASALVFGRLFDRLGVLVLAGVTIFSALFAPLVFLGGSLAAFLGMVLWGIGMGAQESVMRAAIAMMVPVEKRGTGYGIFNAAYGLSWFLGSALMGLLYDQAIWGLVLFSIIVQLVSVPFLLGIRKNIGG